MRPPGAPRRHALLRLGLAPPPRLRPRLFATAGEQAWHRRARRQRQADRAVIAVAAARQRLARHHGGGGDGGGMAQRGNRRGADAPLAKRLIAFLQRECGDGSGGGEPRGRGTASRGAGGGGASSDGRGRRSDGRADQRRDGDWQCRHCSFQPNFGFRQRCWKCGKGRGGSQPPAGGSKQSGRAAGPLGAGGSRPLLGGGVARTASAATADQPPTFRVPGSSLAARAAAARAAQSPPPSVSPPGARQQGAGAPGPRGAAPPKAKVDDVDDEGFRMVQRRKGRGRGDASNDQGDEREEADVDMDGDSDDSAGDDDGDADVAEDDEPEGAPSPSELRQMWQQEVGVVKQLARQGLSPDHPAMVAAVAARDEAEGKWRGAKTPAPLATRLGWAQRKLDRAVNIQAGTRQEMLDLEQQFKADMAALQSRMDEDTARVKKRRQQLESIQVEAGGGTGQRRQGVDGEAVRRACDTLRQEVAPALVALAEQLGTGTDAWSTVNGLLAKLSTSQQVMDKAAEASTQVYDMADDDESFWSESHDLPTGCGGGSSQEDGKGRVDPQPTQRQQQPPQPHHQHHQHDQQWAGRSGESYSDGGGGAHSWGSWHPADWSSAPMWRERGHGQWTRTSWADAWESEHGLDEDMEEQAEPRCKHRRQGEAPYASGEQQQAAGGSSPTSADQAGTEPPQGQASDTSRQHSDMLSHVVEAAINAGVQPLTTTGEELHVLDMQQLMAWAAENLPSR